MLIAEVPAWVNYVGALAGAGSALAAAWAAVAASRAADSAKQAANAASDLTRIERERWLAEQEAQTHAHLVCRTRFLGEKPRHRLLLAIENAGPSPAHNVLVKGLLKVPGADGSSCRAKRVVIQPHETTSVEMPVTPSHGAFWLAVELTWTDTGGRRETATHELDGFV